MKTLFLTLAVLFMSRVCDAQYAPQAGLQGSTAMFKDSSAFVDWGNECTIQRGWLDISDTTLGIASNGDSSLAFGIADANEVSLGDGGEAIYYFNNPIINGIGFDFAIFENGFRNPIDSALAYLELAQVEVSNDGIHYYSFASVSNTDTATQIAGVGTYLEASKLNNLAGKYIANYGTPFDLEELNQLPGLDVNAIRYVKIKDVVGSMNEVDCVKDATQHKINDPYPTPFATGGFDLDAIGIIHHQFPTNTQTVSRENVVYVYPNPTTSFLTVTSKNEKIKQIELFNSIGQLVFSKFESTMATAIDVSFLHGGNYILSIQFETGRKTNQLITKNE